MKKNLKTWAVLTIAITFTFRASLALSQEGKKIPRIGFLVASNSSANSARVEAFQDGLRELGYLPGKNIIIEYRYADGKLARLAELADELVALKTDVIVTAGSADTMAAHKATGTIPIVMTFDNDPVGNHFVASLARPGGNITGVSTFAPELSGKQLELLKELIPKISRVAVVGNSTNPGNALALREIERAGGSLRIKLRSVDVLDREHIETAFRNTAKERDEAFLVLGSPIINSQRKLVVDLAIKHRMPAIYYTTEMVEAGGLVSYGVNRSALARRAANYVDKILKGAKAGDLPVEQPTKFEFVINLKAAKQIGLNIPPSVLARADKVIR